jgi:DNA-binding NtrC family response regulator
VGRHVLGRSDESGAAIVVDDPRVSRTHATLHVASRSFKVRVADEDSRHGTWVNGRQVQEAWLEDGDVLRVGDSHFVLRYVADEADHVDLPALVGRAPAMAALRRTIQQVAPHDVTVMICGESGAGKEVVARAIHQLSGRRGPFIALNCAAIPEALAESQLFGHVSGAFTGAKQDQPGLFRAADGGTLFLDEIGDMPVALQPKLLRALEQREVTPLGATLAIGFDARVIVATHRDLDEAIEDGRFRGDLYARLAQFELPLPPLRERREDVLLLCAHALGGGSRIDADLAALLLRHDWPYNVRELFALVAELKVRGQGHELLTGDLIAHRLDPSGCDEPSAGRDKRHSPSSPAARASAPDRDALVQLVRDNKGNVRAIARATGRSRMQVYRWLEQHGIDLAEYRETD